MAYLENEGIIHRDLALRNILIGKDCIAKVSGKKVYFGYYSKFTYCIKLNSDFGLSRETAYYKIQGEIEVLQLPWKWLSPESLLEKKFTSKSDVWSYGVLIYEVQYFTVAIEMKYLLCLE
jgi:serine/threonine protein kinase